MIQLRPNTTHRFTVSGNPTVIERLPPEGLRHIIKGPRKRFIMNVIPDDDIFFDKLDVGVSIADKMLRAMRDGAFKFGSPRFEIRVNDSSVGPARYYEVRPLDWKANPPMPPYKECECDCCC